MRPVLATLMLLSGAPLAHAATTYSTDLYPGSTIPAGVRVSFTVAGSGFASHPTYKVVDSFPGGVTSVNMDADGNFTWIPNRDDIGSHTITVTLSDSEGTSVDTSKTVTVVASPTLTIGSVTPATTVPIGTTISFPVTTSALFSPTYSVSDPATASTAHGKSLLGTTFSWTPITQDVGVHHISVVAKDSFGSEASSTVSVTVLGPASVATSQLVPGTSVHANQELTFAMSSDGFVNPWYGITDDFTGISSSTIQIDGNDVSWTPQPNDFGMHVLHIGAHDSSGRAATTTLSITVTAPLPSAPPTPTTTPAMPPTTKLPPTTSGTGAAKPAATKPKLSPTKTKDGSADSPATPAAATLRSQSEGSTTLAYPTAVPLSDHIDVPEEVAPFPEIEQAPSFGEFIWQNIDSFFSLILGLFGH